MSLFTLYRAPSVSTEALMALFTLYRAPSASTEALMASFDVMTALVYTFAGTILVVSSITSSLMYITLVPSAGIQTKHSLAMVISVLLVHPALPVPAPNLAELVVNLALKSHTFIG